MSLWCFGAVTCDRVLGALSSWHSCEGLWEWKAERRAPSWAWWAAQPTGKETQLLLQMSGHHKVLLAFSVEKLSICNLCWKVCYWYKIQCGEVMLGMVILKSSKTLAFIVSDVVAAVRNFNFQTLCNYYLKIVVIIYNPTKWLLLDPSFLKEVTSRRM